jgi:hypothetical protein
MAHAEDAARRFAHDGKGFRQNIVQRFPFGQAALEFKGLLLQRRIAQGRKLRF